MRGIEMSDFVRIPEHPEYSISPLGQVRSERSGLVLSHDVRGRVRLRSGKRQVFCFVGDLMAMAGMFAAPTPAEVPAPAQDAQSAELERRLGLARRVNGHLLALVAQLRAEITSLAKAKGKKAKLCVSDDDPLLQPLNFDDELPL